MSQTRRKARQLAVQALYQWQVSANELSDIENQFREENSQNNGQIDWTYFNDLLTGVARELPAVDETLSSYLDRSVEDISEVERVVLRLALYELKFRSDVPYKVIINEAINLAKKFGSEQGHRYVNGILDQAAQTLRAIEVGADNKKTS